MVFDAAGTLIHPAENVAEVYARFAQRFDIDVPVEVIAERFRANRERVFRRRSHCVSSHTLEQRRWEQLVAAVFPGSRETSPLFQALWDYYARPDSWSVYPDAGPLIARLHDRGLSTAIASNFDRRLQGICAGHRELAAIPRVYFSAAVGYCKPDLRFYKVIAADLGRPGSSLLMIGDDQEHDVRAALKAGWQARHLDRTHSDLAAQVFA